MIAQACSTTCTDVGCAPSVALEIKTADGTWPDGVYVIELNAGGAPTRTCSMTLPDDIPESGAANFIGCGLALSPDQVPDHYTLRSSFDSTSRTLGVRITRDGALLLDDTQTIAYEDTRPNGPDCGPVCKNAAVEFQLQ